jgi:hypothetical protein
VSFLGKFFGCLFAWSLQQTDLLGADVIIAHAGGEAKDGTPGPINRYLEEVVRTLHEKTGLPIIAQGELAQCITDLPLYGFIPKQSQSPRYIDSVDVAKIHKQVCNDNGWRHPIVISYGDHLWRAIMVSRKVGFKDVRNLRMKTVYFRECSQWWMSSPWFNKPREILCRLVWLVQRKI